jgi:PAS domain S-box-containing protein/putative nucleotidyltransferase with HDIG domain
MFRIKSDGALLDSRIPKGSYPMWHPDDIHNQTIRALLPPEVAQQVMESVARAFRTEVMEFLEYQIHHGGEPHYHEARIVVCDNHEALVMVRDITIRKKTEAALKESEGKYKSLYESSRDAIMLLDPKNGFLGGNPATLTMFGCTDEADLIAKTPVTFSPEYQPDGVRSALKARILAALALQNGSHFSEWKCMRQDGTEFFASVLLNRVALNGKPVLQATLRDISEQKQAEEELKRTLQRLRKAVDGTIQVIAATVELRDPYTAGHQRRVSDLASEIAREMGLTPKEVDEIRMAALIHDLGKIAIPSDILSKPGKLLAMEFNLIKTHPQVAYNILKDAEIPYRIAEIVLEHHEKMNGSGYPNGLSGEKILMGSRILAVADVVEAMASHRPYRPSLGVEKALEEILQNQGILFDAEVVDICVKLFREKGFKLK